MTDPAAGADRALSGAGHHDIGRDDLGYRVMKPEPADAGRGEGAVAESSVQRLFLDNGSSADVDQHGASRQERQLGGANQVARFWRQGQRHDEDFGTRQKLPQFGRGVKLHG